VTAGEHARGFVRDLGADAVIELSDEGWARAARSAFDDGRGADVILDAVGGETSRQSLDVLAPFGRLVTYGALGGVPLSLGPAEVGRMIFANQAVVGFANMGYLADDRARGRALAHLVSLVERGLLRVEVTRFALPGAAEAHRAIEERRTLGKVVLRT